MLPHEDLAPWYEKAVWLYVCRTWRDDEPDREAARIHDRFGVTSWPHLFLIDPVNDRLLQRAGRTTAAIDQAFASAASKVKPLAEDELQAALVALQSTRERVLALEALARKGTSKTRREVLADLDRPDVLVRHRALLVLKGLDDPPLADHAESLLVEGNDAIRFEVLDWIQKREVEALTPLLVRVFVEAGQALPSGNPNVLRGRAARCLIACGDERAIDALASVARAAEARNSTTRVVVEALGAIGARGDETVRTRVVTVLLASYPAPVEPAANGSPTVIGRYALRLAEAVTKALAQAFGGKRGKGLPIPDLPAGWSEEERVEYVTAVTDRVRAAAGR